jgi:hypothetical protein
MENVLENFGTCFALFDLKISMSPTTSQRKISKFHKEKNHLMLNDGIIGHLLAIKQQSNPDNFTFNILYNIYINLLKAFTIKPFKITRQKSFKTS